MLSKMKVWFIQHNPQHVSETAQSSKHSGPAICWLRLAGETSSEQ